MTNKFLHHLLVRLGLAGAAAGTVGVGDAVANENAAALAESPLDVVSLSAEERTPESLQKLCTSGELRQRRAVPQALAALLSRGRALERLSVLTDWATSTEVEMRRAVAAALALAPDGVGVRAAIEDLAADDDAAVRRAAALAAWSHIAEDPSRYVRLLERLSEDVDLSVREVARAARRG